MMEYYVSINNYNKNRWGNAHDNGKWGEKISYYTSLYVNAYTHVNLNYPSKSKVTLEKRQNITEYINSMG